MTLIEIMVAAALTTAVVAMAMTVVSTGINLARNQEQQVTSNTAARTAMEFLLRDLRLVGVPEGLWVTSTAGSPFRIVPAFTSAGANGTDELWLVVPRPAMLQSNCTTVGSSAVVTESGTGPLTINCSAPLAGASQLLVTNLRSAALVSGVTFPTATTLHYAQQGVAGFSSRPEKGGFQRGDLVAPVDIVHYYVRTNAITNRPELVRSLGALASTPTATTPFVDPGTQLQTFQDVEDLQVAFGSGTAPALTFVSSHAAAFSPATVPISVRVNLVGVTPRKVVDQNNAVLPYGPVTVEDHAATGPIDGYRRSVYRRRVELVNQGVDFL